jgi:hypothetical protein
MRRTILAFLAAAALLGWGLGASVDAGGQKSTAAGDTTAVAAASPSGATAGAASSPSTTGAQATSSPSGTTGAAASSSPSSIGAPAGSASPGGAAAAASPGTTGAAAQSGQRITDRELEQHAQAHEALEQKAPQLFSKYKTSKDPAADFTADERQKFEQALQGTGVSFQDFVRVHQQIVTDQQVRSRFAQIAQQGKAQAGAAQSPASTSGAAATASPPGTTGGAATSGAQPGASPK